MNNRVAEPRSDDSLGDTQGAGNCDYAYCLNNPKTPAVALRLFRNEKINLDEDDPLFLLDSLLTVDTAARPFYFRVITNSWESADGYYSEGLGSFGKEFVEKHPQEFFHFFDRPECFTENDLLTWANIVESEFEIIEGDDPDKRENEMAAYCETLLRQTQSSFPAQLSTARKFVGYLADHR